MSQSINLGWSCQRSKPLEKGNELVLQKNKTLRVVWKFSIFIVFRNVIDFGREELCGYEMCK